MNYARLYIVFPHDIDIDHLVLSMEATADLHSHAQSRNNRPAVHFRDPAGHLVTTLHRNVQGWVAALDLADHGLVVSSMLRLASVSRVRVFATGQPARRLALYPWWGPALSKDRKQTRVRDGVQVEASYQPVPMPNELAEALAGATDGDGPVWHLRATFLPHHGDTFQSLTVHELVEHLARSVGYDETAGTDPLSQLLRGPSVPEFTGD